MNDVRVRERSSAILHLFLERLESQHCQRPTEVMIIADNIVIMMIMMIMMIKDDFHNTLGDIILMIGSASATLVVSKKIEDLSLPESPL